MKKRSIKIICSMLLIFAVLMPLTLMFAGCDTNPSDITENTESVETDAPREPILEADLSKYSLIRPEKTSQALFDQCAVLHGKLMDITKLKDYRDDFYREGVAVYEISEYEILIGKTNRAESKAFLSDLKYNDYGFAQIGKKIVIAGHSEEGTIKALQEFAFAVIHNKDREEGVFYKSEYDFEKKFDYKIGDIIIGNSSLSEYRIVYARRNNISERMAAEQIASHVAAVSGIALDVVSDDEENGTHDKEILVGATNRNTEAENADMLSAVVDNEGLIQVQENRINIAGANATALLSAVSELKKIIGDQPSEKLTLTLEHRTVCKYNDTLLKAMSFNVWVSGRTPERIERVVTMVKNYMPDTIGFQEVNSVWLAALRDGLRGQYAYVGEGRDGGAQGEYNPIFYKKDIFNLIESGTKWLSDTPDSVSKVEESSLNRIYTYALLERKSDGEKIMIVNTHFEHTSSAARVKQAEVLVNALEKMTDYPVILTGDFNCLANTAEYDKVLSSGLINAADSADKKINNAYTYTNYGSSSKIIDFAFVTPVKISVSSYKVCNEKINGDYPSDHHPVLIEYAIFG